MRDQGFKYLLLLLISIQLVACSDGFKVIKSQSTQLSNGLTQVQESIVDPTMPYPNLDLEYYVNENGEIKNPSGRVSNQLLVLLKPEQTQAALDALLLELGESSVPAYEGADVMLVTFEDMGGRSLEELRSLVLSWTEVVDLVEFNEVIFSPKTDDAAFIEQPVGQFSVLAVPINNPDYSQSFEKVVGWEKPAIYDDESRLIDQDILDIVDCRNITIGIIDSGALVDHEDLANSLLDGAFDPGAVNDDAFLDSGHGTHVMGIIAADGTNNIGVRGMCDQARVIPYSALKKTLGRLPLVLLGFKDYYIDAMEDIRERGVDVVNMSLSFKSGEKAEPDSIIKRKMDAAGSENGTIFVIASANGHTDLSNDTEDDHVGDNTDVTPQYPASYVTESDNIIAVANLYPQGMLALSSNYGLESVDIAAPGTYILSTCVSPNNKAPGEKGANIHLYPAIGENQSYCIKSGTSMAAPLVAGVVARYVSLELAANGVKPSPAAVKQRLIDTANKAYPFVDGKVKAAGVLDAESFLLGTKVERPYELYRQTGYVDYRSSIDEEADTASACGISNNEPDKFAVVMDHVSDVGPLHIQIKLPNAEIETQLADPTRSQASLVDVKSSSIEVVYDFIGQDGPKAAANYSIDPETGAKTFDHECRALVGRSFVGLNGENRRQISVHCLKDAYSSEASNIRLSFSCREIANVEVNID